MCSLWLIATPRDAPDPMTGVRGWYGTMLAALLLGGCAGDEPERVIALDEVVHTWAPPGTTILQIAVSSLDGRVPQPLTDLADNAFFPAVSPDGRLIVYMYSGRLWLYDVPQGAVRQFTFGPAVDATPSWSPDGTAVVYASQRWATPESDICIRPLAGGDPVCLTPPDAYDDAAPQMSPDGTQIVWQRTSAEHLIDLWIMNADGSNQRLLLDHSEFDTIPQWSPDGRFILFRSFRYGPPCQFILELATGAIRPVLGDSLNPAFMESATWGPDGRSVIIEVLDPNDRFAEVDLATGDARFINDDTLSYSSWPSMRR